MADLIHSHAIVIMDDDAASIRGNPDGVIHIGIIVILFTQYRCQAVRQVSPAGVRYRYGITVINGIDPYGPGIIRINRVIRAQQIDPDFRVVGFIVYDRI